MNTTTSSPRAPIGEDAPGARGAASDLALLLVMLLAGPPGAFWVTLLLVLRRRRPTPAALSGLLPRAPVLLPEPVRVPVEHHPRS